jgi:hypothetical protein
MEIRYYIDPETDEPHIYNHGVSEREVEQVLVGRGDDISGKNHARIKLGQTHNGRYLKVVYVPDKTASDVFVITAYELSVKAKTAFRRRLRGRRPR